MPDPAANAPEASGSSTSNHAVDQPTTEEVLNKLREIQQEAEEHPESDDGESEDGEGAAAVASGSGGGEASKKKKKKKKKSKAAKAVASLKMIAGGDAPDEVLDAVRAQLPPGETATNEEIQKGLKALDLMKIIEGKQALGRKEATKNLGEHKFWKTQPVPQLLQAQAGAIEEGPIDEPKTIAQLKQEPIALPAGFEWSTVDVHQEDQCKELYTLLSENYVEDDDAMFRFNYSKEFLLWVLTAPGYAPELHVGVRVTKTKKMVAFISGIKVDVRARRNEFTAAEINFMCVHKKLRSKRLAPVLIKEVTRRVNHLDIWQAVYTAGVVIPTPFSTCRYYHRNLNPPKLVDIGFAPLPRGMTVARLIAQQAVPEQPKISGFREMTEKDIPEVGELLRKYLDRFDVAQQFSTDDDVRHWFLSGRGQESSKGTVGIPGQPRVGQVTWAYVVEDPTTHKVTDLISFYSLPSTVIGHPKHDVLNAAYMWYYASDTIFSPASSGDDSRAKRQLSERLNDLVVDIMSVAKAAGFDVLNALTLMDNNMFLTKQKFGAGDGFLNYYFYNWNIAPVDGGGNGTNTQQSSGVGVVML